ncbi:Holliday junction DNA helicase subunit RuvA [Pseudopedobacter saltans DSM 12145]|uniref:Holliday junction branch migration complex subunit RuvA n=1 Tax=Pseudopedobacter saltans (strain ATCC 51119 / DSM 12145 / JCM 21818 / CCUG 39354 / LMG 10337 / NBRC 100064 / NCIMB 13643) TaxID=762903 RepID=F0SBW9_PSESL|nr:Holliday junction branch migration protein RuvA [Pseudopedobacter saltans]ADY53810.1 Holliday junction DNA helicase subunit RuvA [Pseudopedobacter saltans DSM 12145]
MYEYIDGKLVYKCPTYIVLEATGIGYHINISLNTFSLVKDQEKCKLYTWLHVKEDGHTMYGFADEGERRLFLHLISVNGVGPNTARMMLSSISPIEIEQAIIKGEVGLIKSIKGIGPKTAQRLIIDLQDKLQKSGDGTLIAIRQDYTAREEAISALVMLGFAKNNAEKAVDSAVKKSDKILSVEEIIKIALKSL